ncbi:thioredoxin family protein [Aerococcaceae bacterium DSM 111022]|nr:thioredoxin family protein [Aerococcaceae bacterium DSM 111022]
MKKYMKLISILSVIFLLVGFDDIQNNEAVIQENRIAFGENYSIRDLSSNNQQDLYQSLDKILKIQSEMPEATEYEQIETFDDYDSFVQLLENSNEEPQVLYFGYDSCPYCKAFLPKINQMAKEFDTIINHYNTDKNLKSADFVKIVTPFSLQTVPHAFLIENEQVIDILNDQSTMEEIETFFKAIQTEA